MLSQLAFDWGRRECTQGGAASFALAEVDEERSAASVVPNPLERGASKPELAPAHWAQTRARLDPKELEAELGHVTVPPIPADTAEQAAAS